MSSSVCGDTHSWGARLGLLGKGSRHFNQQIATEIFHLYILPLEYLLFPITPTKSTLSPISLDPWRPLDARHRVRGLPKELHTHRVQPWKHLHPVDQSAQDSGPDSQVQLQKSQKCRLTSPPKKIE